MKGEGFTDVLKEAREHIADYRDGCRADGLLSLSEDLDKVLDRIDAALVKARAPHA